MNLQFGDFTAIFDFKGDLFIVNSEQLRTVKELYPQGWEKTAEGCSVWDGKQFDLWLWCLFLCWISAQSWLFQSGNFGKMMTILDLQVPNFLRQT